MPKEIPLRVHQISPIGTQHLKNRTNDHGWTPRLIYIVHVYMCIYIYIYLFIYLFIVHISLISGDFQPDLPPEAATPWGSSR